LTHGNGKIKINILFLFSSMVIISVEMYGRAYQWLIMGTYENAWWNISDTECTVEEIKKALESTVITDLLPLSTSGDITVSGIVISIIFST
jgi:hypothetical protein